MTTAATLKDRRIAARHAHDPDLAEAERLKQRLVRRVPPCLSRDEFLDICRWKLRDQYGRAARLLESSSQKRIKRTTEMALAFKDKEAEFELSGRVKTLSLLPGVGLGVASAILALSFPRKYAPIDSRVWRALFDEERSVFQLADYGRYLARLSEVAAEARALDPKGAWSVQLVAHYLARDDDELSA